MVGREVEGRRARCLKGDLPCDVSLPLVLLDLAVPSWLQVASRSPLHGPPSLVIGSPPRHSVMVVEEEEEEEEVVEGVPVGETQLCEMVHLT